MKDYIISSLTKLSTFLEREGGISDQEKEKILRFTGSDPVASQVSFEPLIGGGTGYKNHKLKKDEKGNIIFSRNTFAIKMGYVVGLLYVGALMVYLFIDLLQQSNRLSFSIFRWLFSHLENILFFLFPIGVMTALLFSTEEKIFDFEAGFYYPLSYKNRLKDYLNHPEKDIIPLREIYALQIARERIKSGNKNYYSYELNLILKNKKRVNVLDHKDIEQIKKDAHELSIALGIKIYDITEMTQ